MALNQEPTALEEEETTKKTWNRRKRAISVSRRPVTSSFCSSDELCDILTTMDPSYVISLIRKLLPAYLTGKQELCTENSGESVDSISRLGVTCSSEHVEESMNLVDDSLELAHRDRVSNETNCQGVGQPDHDISAKKEAWEEYGCILWDLAASKTHAELMVQIQHCAGGIPPA